jgi:hypothetical protein
MIRLKSFKVPVLIYNYAFCYLVRVVGLAVIIIHELPTLYFVIAGNFVVNEFKPVVKLTDKRVHWIKISEE